MQADDIRPLEQLIQRIHIRDTILCRSTGRIWIVRNHIRQEALGQYASCQKPNLACADKPNGLAVDVEANETIEEEVAFANTVVGFMVFADDCEDHADCEFCNGFGRVGRYADNLDVVFLGCFKVDIVETCASEGDVFLQDELVR